MYAQAEMAETRMGVRVELAFEGSASVATGVPVLDHLVGELARCGGLRVTLEVAPGSAEEGRPRFRPRGVCAPKEVP